MKIKSANLDVRFVLVRPRNPMNIGAAARAMANFGFRDLVIVAPYEPIWREAKAAVGAEGVIKKAKKVRDVSQAIKGCHWVIGTSAGQRRTKGQNWVLPEDLGDCLLCKKRSVYRAAILFGSEKSGLTNDELNYCQTILKIPTDKKCPSMNLSHAVAVAAYILGQLNVSATSPRDAKPKDAEIPQPAEVLERLVQQGAKACDASGLFKGWDREGRVKRLRNSLYQWNLQEADVAMLHGLFRVVSKTTKK